MIFLARGRFSKLHQLIGGVSGMRFLLIPIFLLVLAAGHALSPLPKGIFILGYSLPDK
jgi:hypothetical protein